MAVNLSLFDGVPTKESVAREQFKRLYRSGKARAFNEGRYLVLKKLKKGKYKGYWSTFVYETKPNKPYILIKQFPRMRKN